MHERAIAEYAPLVLLADFDGAQLQDTLQRAGFQVEILANAESCVQTVLTGHYQFVVLDRRLPELSSLDTLCAIRRHSNVPILLLTDSGNEDHDEVERILCLELGADDVISRPCSSREIAARMRAILRRAGQAPQPRPKYWQAGPLQLWPQKRSAYLNGDLLPLTSTEYNLLEILLLHRGQPVGKSLLSEQALSRPYQRHDRTIDVHVSNIRHKLGLRDTGVEWIQTVRGFGYQLIAD
ncbi:MAG TPA: response regulator transcription factor [Dongiaceae bacterium]|nr:response regulator transcription factor [Dongiaceae bacterium]